jgi:hypothetical protein
VPPDETGRVPVHYTRAETRYYGVTPSTLVLVLAAAALTLAIVLLVTGHWPVGLIVLGVSLLLALVFVEAARRKFGPGSCSSSAMRCTVGTNKGPKRPVSR